jgi:hypothetical protein
MAGCDVLYFDPTQAGQARRNPAGHPLGPASDGWRPCTAPGQIWTDPRAPAFSHNVRFIRG